MGEIGASEDLMWLILLACTGGDPKTDDTAAPTDDTSTPADDTGAADTAETGDPGPAEGFGSITGDCGLVDAVMLSGGFSSVWNTIDFGDTAYDASLLSEGGQEVIADGNAGGSSLESEAIAYDVLYRCEDAVLLATETEVDYIDDGGKKIDLLVEVDGLQVGVSVTRAYGYPPEDPYTVDQAVDLLSDKLEDLKTIEQNVEGDSFFDARALHVLAYTADHATSLQTAVGQLDQGTLGGALLVVTVTDGDDSFLY